MSVWPVRVEGGELISKEYPSYCRLLRKGFPAEYRRQKKDPHP